MLLSDYCLKLTSTTADRYLEKVILCGGIDPYALNKSDFQDDVALWPAVTSMDIVNYLVCTTSFVTGEQMKAYKSLESYNYFLSGWCHDIFVKVVDINKVLIVGRVNHSQRLRETPLNVWVLTQKDGVILTAHCNCMAGLGEVCSHVGAILFALETGVRLRASSCTDRLCEWLKPASIKQNLHSPVSGIDFTSVKSMKRKATCCATNSASANLLSKQPTLAPAVPMKQIDPGVISTATRASIIISLPLAPKPTLMKPTMSRSTTLSTGRRCTRAAAEQLQERIGAHLLKSVLSQQHTTSSPWPPGLQEISVPGDGDCFFHALAHQVKRVLGQDFDPSTLRAVLTTYLETNPYTDDGSHLDEFLTPIGKTVDTYVAEMRVGGVYADSFILMAAAAALDRPIILFYDDGDSTVFYPQCGTSQSDMLTLGFRNRNHYISLVPACVTAISTISGPPAPTISGPPAPAISGPPAPAISGPPAPTISGPPAPAISGPPAQTVSLPPNQVRQRTPLHYSRPSDAEKKLFFEELQKAGCKAAVLSVVPDYCDWFNSMPQGPALLGDLYLQDAVNLSEDALKNSVMTAFDTIIIDESAAKNIEILTRKQSNSAAWFWYRTGRITASKIKDACHTNLEQPAPSLIKTICYPTLHSFSTVATRWGCEHEKIARKEYESQMLGGHDNFSINDSGLVINPLYPYLGATPDGVIYCNCCGKGVVEIKCPYCFRYDMLSSPTVDKQFCLEMDMSGAKRLKQMHKYYYQAQAQMLICDCKFCDFVVWTEKDMHIERISRNDEFCTIMVAKSKQVFINGILPELITGKMKHVVNC